MLPNMVARRAASPAASFAAPRRRRRAVPFVGAQRRLGQHGVGFDEAVLCVLRPA